MSNVIPFMTADDAYDAYEDEAAKFRADPRPWRIPSVLAAYRRFHRAFCPGMDTEAAVKEVTAIMWNEIRKVRGDAA